MHERKALMTDLSDAFIALPGGLGTLDELFEILTWRTLGLHDKPIGMLDVDSYWRPLLAFLDQGVAHGFIKSSARQLIIHQSDPEQLIDQLDRAKTPA